jgi:hypothetical protein
VVLPVWYHARALAPATPEDDHLVKYVYVIPDKWIRNGLSQDPGHLKNASAWRPEELAGMAWISPLPKVHGILHVLEMRVSGDYLVPGCPGGFAKAFNIFLTLHG